MFANPVKKVNIGILSQIPNLAKAVKLKLGNDFVINEVRQNCGSEELEPFEILVGDYDLLGPHIYSLPNVKFIQGTWAGLDALIPHVKVEHPPPMPIFRFSGKHFGHIISEYAVSTIVIHERNFYQVYENQQNAKWSKEGKIQTYRIISDLTIGVMGIGQIGVEVISVLKQFGAYIKALGATPWSEEQSKTRLKNVDKYFVTNDLREFLTDCDYIINILPNTEQTRGLLNGNALEICKDKSPIFINVGRGSVISDESLLNALQNNWLSHAYLDVFNKEPLPEKHEFWTSPKISITPHVAACSRPGDVAEQFADNYAMFKNGALDKIPTNIDFKKGY